MMSKSHISKEGAKRSQFGKMAREGIKIQERRESAGRKSRLPVLSKLANNDNSFYRLRPEIFALTDPKMWKNVTEQKGSIDVILQGRLRREFTGGPKNGRL